MTWIYSFVHTYSESIFEFAPFILPGPTKDTSTKTVTGRTFSFLLQCDWILMDDFLNFFQYKTVDRNDSMAPHRSIDHHEEAGGTKQGRTRHWFPELQFDIFCGLPTIN